MILCLTPGAAQTVVPGTNGCGTPSTIMVPLPAKQNRISWLGVCECSRTYPPGAMTCIPIAKLSGPACLGLSLTIEYPFAQIGCQYDCPSSGCSTMPGPLVSSAATSALMTTSLGEFPKQTLIAARARVKCGSCPSTSECVARVGSGRWRTWRRWIRAFDSWSRDRQTVMGGGPALENGSGSVGEPEVR